ncbi:MAG: hypothetical protein JST04_05780 [Bdellovibrionales bacterium]|nr:hypothetical protein [Bdellovibrionales bacterium]
MSKFSVLTLVSVFALAASSAFARDITCELSAKAKTVRGIRKISFHKDDWKGSGTVTIDRDDFGKQSGDAIMSDELYWGETFSQDANGAYSVDDTISLRKARDANGVSTYELVRVRRTLSGPHCDGWHSCAVESKVVDRAPISCVDTFDSLPPSEPHRCDPELPGDCE